MAEHVLRYEQALQQVLENARALAPTVAQERTDLLAALGRVLAAPITAPRDHPPFDRSTRDGYAVRAEDFNALNAKKTLRMVGSIRAGESWPGLPLAAGEAIEIMTGAPLPAGADAVVMLEHVVVEGETLRLAQPRTLRAGEHIVARASEARTGDVVLPAGRSIGAAEIAVAAGCGCAEVNVFAKPRVAIIATGDELVELAGQQPEPWQIFNSNSYALAALAQQTGAEPQRLPIARDNLADLRARLAAARDCDLVLFSGGVSAGKFDLVEQLLTEAGAEFFFTGAKIQPGKPIVFGRLPREQGWTYFFGLPGNPISTQVCFHLFTAPLVRALAGETEITPRFAEAHLAEPVRANPDLTRFLPAELTSSFNAITVRLVVWQGSGDLAANARANCYCVLPPRADDFATGETVRVLLR